MSSLDNKLREILIATQPEEIPVTIDEAVDQIKQAFAEAGYVPIVGFLKDNGWLTGQEWYERFEKQLPPFSLVPFEDIIEAAKRASGLEEL